MIKRTVYISGPMTGKPFYNFPAFFQAEKRFRDWGWDVVNPARVDLEGGTISDPPTFIGLHLTVRRDLLLILDNLSPVRQDAIAMLPGWLDSYGALAESFVADWLGLTVLDATDGSVIKNGRTLDSTLGRDEGDKDGALRPNPLGLDGQGSEGVRDGREKVFRQELGEGLPLGVESRCSPETPCSLCTRGGLRQGKSDAPPRPRSLPYVDPSALHGC